MAQPEAQCYSLDSVCVRDTYKVVYSAADTCRQNAVSPRVRGVRPCLLDNLVGFRPGGLPGPFCLPSHH